VTDPADLQSQGAGAGCHARIAAHDREPGTALPQEIDASSDPERALNNFDRFTESIGARRFYYELLLDRPELVRRLTAMFASSEYLSNFLATHPR